MKFYIATGFANAKEHNRVRDMLVALGHEITYDWTLLTEEDLETRIKIAVDEIVSVTRADFLVLLFPGKLGTHVELGAALALGKPVLAVGEMEGDCIFWLHPSVKRIPKLESIFEFLDDLNFI